MLNYTGTLVVAVLSEQEQRMALNFSGWKRCFNVTPDWLQKNFAVHCGLPQGSNAHLVLPLAPRGSLKLLLTGSTGCKKNLSGPLCMS